MLPGLWEVDANQTNGMFDILEQHTWLSDCHEFWRQIHVIIPRPSTYNFCLNMSQIA